MRVVLSLLVLCCSVFAAPVPKDLKRSPESKFDGKWEMVSMKEDGKNCLVNPVVYSICGETGFIVHPTDKSLTHFTLKLNTNAFPFELTETSTKDKNSSTSIVKIEDGFLFLCENLKVRSNPPKDFRGVDGCRLYVFERIDSK